MHMSFEHKICATGAPEPLRWVLDSRYFLAGKPKLRSPVHEISLSSRTFHIAWTCYTFKEVKENTEYRRFDCRKSSKVQTSSLSTSLSIQDTLLTLIASEYCLVRAIPCKIFRRDAGLEVDHLLTHISCVSLRGRNSGNIQDRRVVVAGMLHIHTVNHLHLTNTH